MAKANTNANFKPADPVEVENALRYIDANTSRDNWVKIGAALKTEFGENGFELFDEWSKTADKQYKASDTRSTWKSLKGGYVNIGTVFYQAKQNGFQFQKAYTPPSPEQQAARKAAQERAAQKAEAQRKAEAKAATAKSIERWNNAKPVDPNHPYLVKKGITDPEVLKGLRQEGNNILVPLKQYGKMTGVQSIDPNGRKLFEKNISLDGSNMIIGSWAHAQKYGVVVAEGLATAASIHQATKRTVMVGFTGHNVGLVANSLKNANMNVVIAADNDRNGAGMKYAEQAVSNLGEHGVIATPALSEKDREDFQMLFESEASDFNDLAKLKGDMAVRETINNAFTELYSRAAVIDSIIEKGNYKAMEA